MSDKILHDPLSGFHDIAGPPAFFLAQNWIEYLIYTLLIIFIGYALFFAKKRFLNAAYRKNLSAYDRLLQRIHDIENNQQQTTLREVSSALSLALRSHLDDELNTNTSEHTRKELFAKLAEYKAQFQNSDYNQFISELAILMEKLEFLTFSDQSEMLYKLDPQEFQKLKLQSLKLARMVRDRKLMVNTETELRNE